MAQWAGSLAVVTGASAGIGAAFVEKLMQAEINVSTTFQTKLMWLLFCVILLRSKYLKCFIYRVNRLATAKDWDRVKCTKIRKPR